MPRTMSNNSPHGRLSALRARISDLIRLRTEPAMKRKLAEELRTDLVRFRDVEGKDSGYSPEVTDREITRLDNHVATLDS